MKMIRNSVITKNMKTIRNSVITKNMKTIRNSVTTKERVDNYPNGFIKQNVQKALQNKPIYEIKKFRLTRGDITTFSTIKNFQLTRSDITTKLVKRSYSSFKTNYLEYTHPRIYAWVLRYKEFSFRMSEKIFLGLARYKISRFFLALYLMVLYGYLCVEEYWGKITPPNQTMIAIGISWFLHRLGIGFVAILFSSFILGLHFKTQRATRILVKNPTILGGPEDPEKRPRDRRYMWKFFQKAVEVAEQNPKTASAVKVMVVGAVGWKMEDIWQQHQAEKIAVKDRAKDIQVAREQMAQAEKIADKDRAKDIQVAREHMAHEKEMAREQMAQAEKIADKDRAKDIQVAREQMAQEKEIADKDRAKDIQVAREHMAHEKEMADKDRANETSLSTVSDVSDTFMDQLD